MCYKSVCVWNIWNDAELLPFTFNGIGTAWLARVTVQRTGCCKSLIWILDAESTYLQFCLEHFSRHRPSQIWYGAKPRTPTQHFGSCFSVLKETARGGLGILLDFPMVFRFCLDTILRPLQRASEVDWGDAIQLRTTTRVFFVTKILFLNGSGIHFPADHFVRSMSSVLCIRHCTLCPHRSRYRLKSCRVTPAAQPRHRHAAREATNV